jgi:hypothetical protein
MNTLPRIPRVGETMTMVGFASFQTPPLSNLPPNYEETFTPKVRSALKHWARYGQQGYTPKHRVTASQWKRKPFVKPVTSQWHIALQPHQLPILVLGFRPRVNEDKWFVYAEGPDVQGHVRLHMHRSWSGDKMAEVIIEAGPVSRNWYEDGSTFVDGIVWESDPEQIKEPSEEQAKEMAREVCNWVLNVQLGEEVI